MRKNTVSIKDKMELINKLNAELKRKIESYGLIIEEVRMNHGRNYLWPSDTSVKKCSSCSIKRTITLMREQLLLLEKEL